ncbi:MAG: ABC transporter permease [Chloroflexi bacterium]|nr:MAG: ABC transporter permease [Chloroflexota bacterium]
MRRVFVILQKEWIEIRQQWTLLFTIVLPPLFLTVLPLFVLAQFNRENLQTHGSVSIDYPSMQGMTFKEALQTQVGMQLSIMYVLLPGIITSVIASYSVIGEKTSRTLEPVLATPIRTWELLLGKSLAALIPGVGVTWLSGFIFLLGLPFFVDQRVFGAIVSPGWLVLFLLWSPLLALIAIAIMLAVSSRVNDARSAQQVSAWLIIPFLAVFFGQLAGVQVLGPVFTVIVALILGVLAIVTLWVAVRIFQRETILTRWK